MVKIVGQPGITPLKQQEFQKVKQAKEGPSKFEQKRAELLKRQSDNVSLPPQVTQISLDQRQILESNFRKRLEGGNIQQVLKADFRDVRAKFDGLSRQVTAAPKSPALEAIGNRLKGLESQFKSTEKVMRGLSGQEDSKELLQIQMQMYTVTQNIEILAKATEELCSGTKSLLQTSV
jgi:hypothetical protein